MNNEEEPVGDGWVVLALMIFMSVVAGIVTIVYQILAHTANLTADQTIAYAGAPVVIFFMLAIGIMCVIVSERENAERDKLIAELRKKYE